MSLYKPKTKQSIFVYVVIGFVLCGLISSAVILMLLRSSKAKISKARLPQIGETVSVKYENSPDVPLIITDAYAEVGEPEEMFVVGRRFTEKVVLIPEGEKGRRVKFSINLMNRSQFNIDHFMIKIENPAMSSGESMLVRAKLEILPGKKVMIVPQTEFTFNWNLPFHEQRYGLELMNKLTEFRLRIVYVGFELRKKPEWIEGGEYRKLYSNAKYTIQVDDCREANSFDILGDKPSSEQRMNVPGQEIQYALVARTAFQDCHPEGTNTVYLSLDTIQNMTQRKNDQLRDLTTLPTCDRVLRPNIIYKEKATYTKEARDKKIEGVVVLNVVYTWDGRVTNISVIRGLSHGLTEKAIEAARKIGFRPARKDGDPVSVRCDVEFNFTLDR